MAPRPFKPGYEGGAFISKLHPNASIALDERHYAAIGRVAASWSLLEYAIDFAINHLSARGPEQGYCVTSQILQASNKMKALISLLDLREIDKKKLEKADKFLRRIYDVSEQRNRVIHDVWFRDAAAGTHFRHQLVDKKGKLILDSVPVDLGKIENLILAITKLRKDFVEFWMSLPAPDGMFPSTSILLQEESRPVS